MSLMSRKINVVAFRFLDHDQNCVLSIKLLSCNLDFIPLRFLLVRISLSCKTIEPLINKALSLALVNPFPITSEVSLTTIFVACALTLLTSRVLGILGLLSTKILKIPFTLHVSFSFRLLIFLIKMIFQVISVFSLSQLLFSTLYS